VKSVSDAPALIAASWRQLVSRTNNFLGRKLYEYFNWRQDTSKDLLVTFGVFSMLVLAAAFVRRWGVDEPSERAMGNLWADVYQVSTCAGHAVAGTIIIQTLTFLQSCDLPQLCTWVRCVCVAAVSQTSAGLLLCAGMCASACFF
jgi:hypothetical protein